MKTTNCLDFDSEYDRDNTKYPFLFLFNPLTPTLSHPQHRHQTARYIHYTSPNNISAPKNTELFSIL